MISEAMRPTCEESCSEMAIGAASAKKNNTVSKVRRGGAETRSAKRPGQSCNASMATCWLNSDTLILVTRP